MERPYGFDLTIDVADARWLTVTHGAGGVGLTAAKRVHRGRFYGYSRRVELGMDADTGRIGKVVDHTFRAGEGRGLIRRAAEDLGWKEQMDREQAGAPWFAGIVAVLMVIGLGAMGVHALLT